MEEIPAFYCYLSVMLIGAVFGLVRGISEDYAFRAELRKLRGKIDKLMEEMS